MKLSLVGLTAMAACSGGGSGGDFAEESAELVGIYQIDSRTRNEAACSSGGDALTGSDTFVVAYQQTFFGITLLNVLSCASPADCRDKASDTDGFSFEFSYTVEALGAEGSFVGGGSSTGFGDGEVCTEAEVFSTVLTVDGDQLRVEQRVTVADDYPADREGFCTTDLAREAAAGKTCSAMEVLTATFVESL